MDRRTFIGAVAGALLGSPLAIEAQQMAKIPRIGFLSAAPLSSITTRTEAFRRGLRDLGYVEGRSIVLEWRSADDTWSRLPALAAELVSLNLVVIVTADGPAILAAQKATRSIPIVMGQSPDPVAMGVVASLAHPGANVTGLTTLSIDLLGKQVELLKQTVPKLSRLAVLSNPANPMRGVELKHAEITAQALGIQVQSVEVGDPAQFGNAFAAMTRERADAFVVLPDAMFLTQRTQIAEIAAKSRLPAIYGIPEHVEAGGLMGYAASRTDLFRRAAGYVDRILKGANPGDLPVEQPTKFELVINLKTAKALGLTIPQSVLVRADELIQ
jgi:putative ABC transport system substrate-binding protein